MDGHWSPKNKDGIRLRNLISEVPPPAVSILSSVLRGAAGVSYTVFIAKEMSQLEYKTFLQTRKI